MEIEDSLGAWLERELARDHALVSSIEEYGFRYGFGVRGEPLQDTTEADLAKARERIAECQVWLSRLRAGEINA